MNKEKVVRDGSVAVLISPGFGAGWSTWNSEHADVLLFHPKLVEWVEGGKVGDIEDVLSSVLGLPEDDLPYAGGASDLTITWLPEGTSFTVEEYDGSESIRTFSDLRYVA
jgi:hypothetical protein